MNTENLGNIKGLILILILVPATAALPTGVEDVKTFDNQTSFNLEEKNKSVENMYVVTSFQANITNAPVEISFENSTEQLQKWMTENKDLYNGNNIVYSDGLLNIYSGKALRPEFLQFENGYRYNVTRNGSYVLALETFETERTVITDGRSCFKVYNYSGLENPEEYKVVEDCQERNYIEYMYYILTGVTVVYLIYVLYRWLRQKMLLHKISKVTEKIKDSNSISNSVLNDLYQANNYALDNQYRKAEELLNKIETRI